MTILAPHTVLVTFADLCRLADVHAAMNNFTNGHCVSVQFSTEGEDFELSWYDAAGLDIPEPAGLYLGAAVLIAAAAKNFLVSFLAGLELESERPQLSLF